MEAITIQKDKMDKLTKEHMSFSDIRDLPVDGKLHTVIKFGSDYYSFSWFYEESEDVDFKNMNSIKDFILENERHWEELKASPKISL